MDEKLYKIRGFFWEYDTDINGETWMRGPYCPKCNALLDARAEYFNCSICEKEFKIDKHYNKIISDVNKIYDAKAKEKYTIISLDEPPTHVKVNFDDDQNYFLSAKIGQKNGKKVGIVYFGEKNKDQKKEDYSQIFIDLDDEQLRFDKANKHPKNILCKFTAEFPDVNIEQIFKEKNNKKYAKR